jgi:hypothetical protein
MTKLHSTLLFATLLPAHAMLGQAHADLSIGGVRARFYSNGRVSADTLQGIPNFELPAGNGTHGLYTGGLWIGGQDASSAIRLSQSLYESQGGMHFFPGPLRITDGVTDPTSSQAYDRVWSVTRAQVMEHLSYHQCLSDPNCDPSIAFPGGYSIPPDFIDWPAEGDVSNGYDQYLAPFFDFNNDGNYSAADGDAPCIIGDQALFSVFNDYLGILNGNQGLGIEVHQMPFAYESSDPYLRDAVFISYRIINRSAQAYSNTLLGFFNDFDIGCPDDDFIGCDPSRNLAYAYNWDDEDLSCSGVQGFGPQPPALGMALLKGPLSDANGSDDAASELLPNWNGQGFGDGIADNERFGLSHFIYFNRDGDACCNDPSNTIHSYGYLRGIWKDGLTMTYGGDGHDTDPSAITCAFMYPGTGDPVGAGTGGQIQPPWSELVQTPLTIDRRGLMSMGAFTLEPGENMHLLFAYVYAQAASGGATASVEALRSRVDSVTAFAQGLPFWDSPESQAFGSVCADYLLLGIDDRMRNGSLLLAPSPAQDRAHFAAPASLVGGVLTLRDAIGRFVLQQRVQSDRNTIDVSGLAKGLYTIDAVSRNARYTGRLVKE